MKKVFMGILAFVVFATAMVGTVSASSKEFNEAAVVKKLDVKFYQYSSYFGTPWVLMLVKNNSEYNLDIEVTLTAYDSKGGITAAKDKSQEAFEKGSQVILTFMLDEKPNKLKYAITAEEEEYYDCVVSDLTYETNSAKDKEVVTVTNKGKETADFVEGTMIFLKNGKAVNHDTTYFTDKDSELKPGKTISKELDSYEKYDEIIFCLTGRRDK